MQMMKMITFALKMMICFFDHLQVIRTTVEAMAAVIGGTIMNFAFKTRNFVLKTRSFCR